VPVALQDRVERLAWRHPDATALVFAAASVGAAVFLVWKLIVWTDDLADVLGLAIGVLLGIAVWMLSWAGFRRRWIVSSGHQLALTSLSLLGGVAVFEVAYASLGGSVRVAAAEYCLLLCLGLLPSLVMGRRFRLRHGERAQREMVERSREVFPRS
jgi:hypothetical protein